MQIVNIVEIVVSVFLVAFALIAVFSKNLISSIIFLSIMSMLAVVAFTLFRAPDVAITEAVVGSGLITFIFVITIRTAKKAGGKK
ncbi:MAG: DUF4040 domain-containing protein [Clostridiales bacterium]|nr:DUF4040 domain-containing protein [Clostridiales bacterium]